jgi:hypothetical protein
MSEMAERIGNAVRKAVENVAYLDDSMNDIIACAVFEAMREPTEQMIDAGQYTDDAGGDFWIGRDAAETAYRKMISAEIDPKHKEAA